MKKFGIGGIVLGVLLVIGLIVGLKSYTKIDPGHAGVIYNLSGGIEDTVLSQGGHFVAPWKKITEYPVSTETVSLSKSDKDDKSFNVSTREGKQVSLDTRYAYHMDATKLPSIFTKFRGANSSSIENGYIKTALQASIQTVTSSYGVLDIYGSKRDEITAKVFGEFKGVLEADGIIVETFSFGEIRPDATTLEAIQENVNAQQKLATLQVQKQQATAEAERLIIEAQGKADAALIAAEGQAKANKALVESLTDKVVNKLWIEKWDGKLPSVQTGSSGVMLNVTPDISNATTATK